MGSATIRIESFKGYDFEYKEHSTLNFDNNENSGLK